METRAHYVLIGVFTLLMIAAGFGLVLFFSGAGSLSVRRTYEIVFDGPVGGLGRGSSVTYSGLRVGEVTWVDLDPKDPRRVIAYFQIGRNLTLHADVQARLESQGLTGNAAIALSGGTPDAPVIKGEYGEAPIHGEGSQFQSLIGRIDSLSQRADSILAKVDKIISDNGDPLTDVLKNVETFSRALSSNASGVQGALGAVADLSKRAGPLADRLTQLTDDIDHIVKGLDAGQLNHILDDVAKFGDSLSDSRGDVKSLASDAAAFAKRLNDASGNISGIVDRVKGIADAIDPKKIASLVDGGDALGSVLQENRGNIDRLVKNASELSAKLNESADKVDALLDSAQSFLGSSTVKGPLAQVGDAAKSLRQLSDDLDERVKQISVGLTRFSYSGLKEYESLAVEARHTIGDVDKLVKSLENNPSQIIFGAKKQ